MTGTAAQYDGTTYVIPCGGAKVNTPAPARDLYAGQMFAHTLAAAEKAAAWDRSQGIPARVLILSALHGLVELDTVLAPYDVKMGDPQSVTPAVLAAQATALGLGWGSEVYAFLPAAYFTALDTALRTLDVYPAPVYEAAPGIGYQRAVNCHA